MRRLVIPGRVSSRAAVSALVCLAVFAAVSTAWAQPATVVPVPRDQKGWMDRHESMNARVKQGNVDMLFIGGSGIISHASVERAVRLGHHVTVLNRGQSTTHPLPEDVEFLVADVHDGAAVDEVVLLDHTVDDLRSCDFVDFVDFVRSEGLRQ